MTDTKVKIFDFILQSPLLPVIGIISSLIGIVAYFLPWTSNGYEYTAMDFLTGNSGELSGIQAYLPTVLLAFMVIILALSVLGVTDKRRALGFYGMIIFGFVGLALVVMFGNWVPVDDYKILVNGGLGFYLEMLACIIYIFAGIVGYSVRPLPPPPAKKTNQARK